MKKQDHIYKERAGSRDITSDAFRRKMMPIRIQWWHTAGISHKMAVKGSITYQVVMKWISDLVIFRTPGKTLLCEDWNPHSDDYDEFCRPGYNTSIFWRGEWGKFCLLHVSCWFLTWLTLPTANTDPTCSSETSVAFQRTTQRYTPDDGTLENTASLRWRQITSYCQYRRCNE
jgi:hypothetical protein